MLTEKEFYTLKAIVYETGQVTQRELVEATGYSLGTINKIINDFIRKEYIDSNYKLKPEGKKFWKTVRCEMPSYWQQV